MADVDLKTEIDALDTSGTGLRAVFARAGDRFGHTIGWWTGKRFEPLLESIEGDAAQAWPPSPALQQLHLEARGEKRRVALLVGMAGRSHWSLSVEAAEAPMALLFDAACRISGGAHSLGSRYRALRGTWHMEAPNTALLATSHAEPAIVVEAMSGVLTADDSCRELSILPAMGEAERTVRWKYWVKKVFRV
jgi:hypothetical protein